jgi:hypothetical protein
MVVRTRARAARTRGGRSSRRMAAAAVPFAWPPSRASVAARRGVSGPGSAPARSSRSTSGAASHAMAKSSGVHSGT